jgi:hypothetical protein
VNPRARQVETNNGHAKPDRRGTTIGECVSGEYLTPTGKRMPMRNPDGSVKGWLAIKEKRLVVHWVWDGTDWVLPETMDARAPNAGQVMVRKRDFGIY